MANSCFLHRATKPCANGRWRRASACACWKAMLTRYSAWRCLLMANDSCSRNRMTALCVHGRWRRASTSESFAFDRPAAANSQCGTTFERSSSTSRLAPWWPPSCSAIREEEEEEEEEKEKTEEEPLKRQW